MRACAGSTDRLVPPLCCGNAGVNYALLRDRRPHPHRWLTDDSRIKTLPGALPPQRGSTPMAKIAKTGDRKKVMDTTRSTDCPKCSKPTRIAKRVKDRGARHTGRHCTFHAPRATSSSGCNAPLMRKCPADGRAFVVVGRATGLRCGLSGQMRSRHSGVCTGQLIRSGGTASRRRFEDRSAVDVRILLIGNLFRRRLE